MYEFPTVRMRRRRTKDWLLRLLSEVSLSVNDLVMPLFVHSGSDEVIIEDDLDCLTVFSVDMLLRKIEELLSLKINAIAIFPVVPHSLKTMDGKEAVNPDNLVCTAIRLIRKHFGDSIGVIADVALDPYTVHGHDGILYNGDVDNDATIDILSRQAIVLAASGCDVIAPSDMMDGRVGAIRSALDAANFYNVSILSYAVKYCSCFYSVFRRVVGSKLQESSTSKKSYQINFCNKREAMTEVELDISEGADFVIVKPLSMYLDVVSEVRRNFSVPVFGYHVSGEYAMLRAAASRGWLNYEDALVELIVSFKRAGVDVVITYAAVDIAKFLIE